MSLFTEKLELGVQELKLDTGKTLNQMPWILKWGIILAVFATLPAYFIVKNISLRIWTSRYSQGALTAKPSFSNPKPPVLSAVSITTMGENTYAAIVKVSNPNLELSAQGINYTFKFYDEKKQLLYTSPTETFFLLPDQGKYLTVPRFTTGQPVAFSEIKISEEINWQKKLDIPKITLVTPQPETYHQQSPPAFVVEGNYLNQSPYNLKSLRLTFVLYNYSNQIIGLSQRDEFSVAPFERRSYKQLWPFLAAVDLAKVEVLADTNPLDPNNIITEIQTPGSSSDLSRPTNKKSW